MGKSLTKEQQYMIVGLVVLIGCLYAYWNYLLNPTMQKIVEQEKKHKSLVSQIEKAKRQAKRLPALKNQSEKLERDLAKLEKQLPKGTDMPNILRTITREAMRENLEFSKIAPAGNKRRTYFESIPFSLAISGGLHSVVRFLAAMGQQERIFQASDLKLRPGGKSIDGGKTNLKIDLKLETYAYRG